MNCPKCGAKMEHRKATPRSPFHYTFSGLENVFLCDITVHRCAVCRTESPVIPRPAELHRVIADTLARKPAPLSGAEVRYLRKNMGVPAKKLAAVFGITPETLSRIENGKRALRPGLEQLLRVMAMTAATNEPMRETVFEIANQIERGRAKTAVKRIKFVPKADGGWKKAA